MKRKVGILVLNILCRLFVMLLAIATWKTLVFREILLLGEEGGLGNDWIER
jgi:hypothetical protein